MNIRIKNPLRDPQEDQPIAYCPRCGGEIYEEDDVDIFGGDLVHEDCLTEEEREDCVLRRAASCFENMF